MALILGEWAAVMGAISTARDSRLVHGVQKTSILGRIL
jgi:hypothetical protein